MAVLGAGVIVPDSAQAATNVADSTLVNVTIDNVPVLGQQAFQGTYATSGVAQNGGDDAADPTQDPDGVLKHLTINGSPQSETHSDPAKNWAQAQLPSSVTYSLHGKQIYSVASLDSYTDCASQAHADAGTVKVLGTSIPAGKTTTVPVTGSQLGARGIDHGSLKVTFATTANPVHAYMDLDFTGTFYDSDGKQLYSGPIQKVRFGDVQATCPSTPPSSVASSTTTTPPPAAPPTPTGTDSFPVDPASLTSAPAAMAANPHGPANVEGPAPRHWHHSTQSSSSHSNKPAAPQNGPLQPAANTDSLRHASQSGPSGWWAALSVIALGAGVMLFLSTRRRGKHQ